MKLRVKLFAVAKDLAGRGELVIEAPPEVTIAELRQIVGRDVPALEKILPHAMWAVDAAYAGDGTRLTDDSEIALIPPVSGG